MVFSIEALLSLLALVGFALLFIPSPASTQKEFYLNQLVQDVLEVSVKSEENRINLIEFAGGDENAGEKIEEKYSHMLEALGDYCLIMEVNARKIEINCVKREENGGMIISAERILYNGRKFMVLRASISLNR